MRTIQHNQARSQGREEAIAEIEKWFGEHYHMIDKCEVVDLDLLLGKHASMKKAKA